MARYIEIPEQPEVTIERLRSATEILKAWMAMQANNKIMDDLATDAAKFLGAAYSSGLTFKNKVGIGDGN